MNNWKTLGYCYLVFTFFMLSACTVSYVENTTQKVLQGTHLKHHHQMSRHHQFGLSPDARIYLYGLSYSEEHHVRERDVENPRLQLARDQGFLQAFQHYFPHTMAGEVGLTMEEVRNDALLRAAEFMILPHFLYDSAESESWKIKHSKYFNLVLLDIYTWEVLDTFSVRSEQFWFSPVRKDSQYYADAASAVASHLSPHRRANY